MQLAVLIPCRNEEAAIAQVVSGFRATLPEALVYVYDNSSTDRTRERAAGAGAVVRSEPRVGKGNVVSRMFADVDADVYLLVDGDGTYDVASALPMVEKLWRDGLDVVTGVRVSASRAAYRIGHRLGNRLLSGLVSRAFSVRCADVLSGYRVFSRRFVKSFSAPATGFEVETALTVHALELQMPVAEMEIPYGTRSQGSTSKLRTGPDGVRILVAVLRLLLEVRPVYLMGMASLVFTVLSVVLAYPVLATYVETGLVLRLPTAVLSASLMVIAFLGIATGLILEMLTRGRWEAKRLHYLLLPAPGPDAADSCSND
jgi:glycosyltransferase involved in cell wall biosynthesis